MVASALDDVEGVGKIRRKTSSVGGLEQLKAASLEQISSVPGIGKKAGTKIFELFHKDKPS